MRPSRSGLRRPIRPLIKQRGETDSLDDTEVRVRWQHPTPTNRTPDIAVRGVPGRTHPHRKGDVAQVSSGQTRRDVLRDPGTHDSGCFSIVRLAVKSSSGSPRGASRQ
jgi:hypothetical protein